MNGRDYLEEFVAACHEEKAFDFVSNNYWDMTKEELKRIALEAIHVAKNDNAIADEVENWL